MISKAVLRWVLATSLPWPLLLIYAALLAALAHAGSQAPTWMEYLQWTPGLSDWLAWNARADGWSMALLIVGTGMCARAAWLVERWKRHDIDWLRTRPVSAVQLHASVLLALLIAALAWLGIGAAVLETLPPPKLAHEARGRVAAQDAIWVDGQAPERVRIADEGDGDALSLAWIATRGAPQVRLHAGWQGAEEFATAEITTRGRLLIPLPAKDSARVLELRVEPEQAAALWAPMDSYVLQRSGNPRESALRMVAQAWTLIGLAMCASLLCALWMRAGIAVALVAVLLLALSTRLPAPEALHYMRQGWLPRWPGSNLMAAIVIGCTLTPLLAGWSWSRLRRQR